jgi:hypothetical protein
MRTAWFLATISLMMASSAHAADSGSSAAVRFRTHVIEPDIANGYQTLIVDLNRDGKPDVIGLSGRLPALYWYENPGWERHVISVGHNRMITVAAADLNGDGIPELGLGTDFGQTESASEGRVYVLEHQGDPRQPWKATEIDRLPTTHRMRFADLDGDGKPELVNSPLTGKSAAAPLFECQGSEVGHLDGRVRVERRHVQQLRDRARGRPGGTGRRVRPGLSSDARDLAARDRDVAPEDRRW